MPGSVGTTRRELFGIGAGALAAAHPLTRFAHGSGRPRRRTPSRPLAQIQHVVILMQENRSFDNYFGTLRGVRGFSDPNAIKLADGQSVFHQPYTLASGGHLLPWRLDIARANPCSMVLDNSWNRTHDQLAGGRMDGFASAGGPDAMAYHTRADIPWHTALADGFTVCDAYFASVLSATDPNRLYSMTGTIDPAGRHGGPVRDNYQTTPSYTWTTYPERLQAKGISWRVYQETDNFDDNPLAWFASYQQAKPGSALFENGMRRRDVGAFADDVASGRLPQVSWIVAPALQSEHPGFSPGYGADFCNLMLQALFAHPKVWAKTVAFITYDEPGGYFDHVRPPLPPPGTPDEFVGGLPIGLGFRVPTMVCSPWSRGGYVSSQTFDHTSLLRFLERRFGVREPQISAWRRATCGDLVSTLDFKRPDFSIPQLPAIGPIVAASQQACGHHLPGIPPLLSQQMPVQEAGGRRRR
jgi:phospholipase C